MSELSNGEVGIRIYSRFGTKVTRLIVSNLPIDVWKGYAVDPPFPRTPRICTKPAICSRNGTYPACRAHATCGLASFQPAPSPTLLIDAGKNGHTLCHNSINLPKPWCLINLNGQW